jgi:serine/alanine adding enzyme
MALRIVTDSGMIDRRKWEEFVTSHPEGSILQMPWMYDVHGETRHQRAKGLFALDGERLVGLMVVINFWNAVFPISYFTRRQVVYGGPLVIDNDKGVLLALLETLVKETGWKAVFSEIRNSRLGLPLKPIYEEAGFYYESYLSVIVDMSRKPEELWASLSLERKKNICKMGEVNYTIRDLSGVSDMLQVWRILRCSIGERGRPIPHRSLFYAVNQSEVFKSHLKIKGMEIDRKIRGVILILTLGDKATIWFEGHCLPVGKEWLYDGFLWGVIQELQTEGIRFLDLGKGGRPGRDFYIRQYKKSYGGMIKETGRYIYIHNWLLWGLGKVFYRWYKKTKMLIYSNSYRR